MWNPFSRKVEEADEVCGANRVHFENPQAREILTAALRHNLTRHFTASTPLVLLCIGTDRSTGDCLGPLIGTRLSQRNVPVVICGTLDEPVHAVNLQETLDRLKARYGDPFVLAIDACLGRTESVGYVSVKDGPLMPGTGVNKTLPAAGNLHIIGIVNVGGFMEYLVLQNTRLSLVMRMADLIADSIEKCLSEMPVSAIQAAGACEEPAYR